MRPPQLYGTNEEENRGKLSANKFDSQSVENQFSPQFDKPLATQRQILRSQLFESYNADSKAFLKQFSALSETDQATVLDLLK